VAVIAVDTNVLIWGVRKERPDDRPDLVERCARLLEDYKSTQIPIMVPSIVVAEYLIGHTLDQQSKERGIIGSNFFVAPFDAKAAAIAAQLYDASLLRQARRDTEIGRQCLQADFKILATAIAHGATVFYTDDPHMTAFAAGKILVKEIPTKAALAMRPATELQGPQQDLFEEDDSSETPDER
jgi:predicted nucleic acid-binding protein